ncbi:hypothetical protein [Streptomyces sp. NPDC057854]|uniref:hypothetical protein n=1 Tax=unclassified Streptomyces TaxID=2593676 RepID=UPI0036A12960
MSATWAIEATDEKALAVLREVVAERPEYVYSCPEYMAAGRHMSCFYAHTDEEGALVSAGCVVGVVLNRLGMPLEELAKEEGSGAFSVITRHFPTISGRVRDLLHDVQMSQDSGDPWGLAYAKATGKTI